MRQVAPETGDENEESGFAETSWFQLSLELLVFCGIAVLLLLTAIRIPPARVDGNIVLGIAVALHAAGLVRLALRAADFAGSDSAR